MQIFKSYYHKNMSKSFWASKLCYVISSFVLNNNYVEKKTNIKQDFFFSFFKNSGLKSKNNNQHNCTNQNETVNIFVI